MPPFKRHPSHKPRRYNRPPFFYNNKYKEPQRRLSLADTRDELKRAARNSVPALRFLGINVSCDAIDVDHLKLMAILPLPECEQSSAQRSKLAFIERHLKLLTSYYINFPGNTEMVRLLAFNDLYVDY